MSLIPQSFFVQLYIWCCWSTLGDSRGENIYVINGTWATLMLKNEIFILAVNVLMVGKKVKGKSLLVHSIANYFTECASDMHHGQQVPAGFLHPSLPSFRRQLSKPSS